MASADKNILLAPSSTDKCKENKRNSSGTRRHHSISEKITFPAEIIKELPTPLTARNAPSSINCASYMVAGTRTEIVPSRINSHHFSPIVDKSRTKNVATTSLEQHHTRIKRQSKKSNSGTFGNLLTISKFTMIFSIQTWSCMSFVRTWRNHKS